MIDVAKAVAKLSDAKQLSDVYSVLSNVGMGPGWNKPEPSLWPAPRKTFNPAHWSYTVAKAALDAAGPLISTELAERRNLILANPIPGNTYGTARTLVAAYQMVRPHETARSHRHTPNALRLVVDAAPETYTIVQGKKIPMLPGDVLLTPNWLWHGHANDSDQNAYWIDFLDAPLVQLLEPMFLEHFPDGIEKTDDVDGNSPMRFAYAETQGRLDAAKPAQDGTLEVELGNPALDTIALFVRRLKRGDRSAPVQSTANNIYAVIEGEGVTTIDDQSFAWQRGDVFVAPGWRKHVHEAKSNAHLLRVTDEPVLQKFRWLRAFS
jgi:gentisate 1,2-dioxygenase